jgi:hypothetical protein
MPYSFFSEQLELLNRDEDSTAASVDSSPPYSHHVSKDIMPTTMKLIHLDRRMPQIAGGTTYPNLSSSGAVGTFAGPSQE